MSGISKFTFLNSIIDDWLLIADYLLLIIDYWILIADYLRYISISNPLSSLNSARQRRRARWASLLTCSKNKKAGKVEFPRILRIFSKKVGRKRGNYQIILEPINPGTREVYGLGWWCGMNRNKSANGSPFVTLVGSDLNEISFRNFPVAHLRPDFLACLSLQFDFSTLT